MKKIRICRYLLVFIVMWGLSNGAAGAAADVTVVKVAVITPEGSAWTNSLYQLAAAVKERTKGAVTFTVYAGGIAGDELDVLRKMQADRIQAAGFSGVGLGVLVPQIRILEAPLLYKTEAEVDFVKQKLADRFAAEFEKKGFVLLGFAEAGFVYFFSSTLDDRALRGSIPSKCGSGKATRWPYQLEALGIKTYPLQLTDVNTGLETGMINAFYAPPAAAIAYQWYAKVRFMLDYPMVNSTGAFLVKKNTFDRLSEENREILREASAGFCNELVQISRRVNAEAREVLLKSGIVFEKPTEEQLRLFDIKARQIYSDSIDRLYSRELFDTVSRVLEDQRR